jgi:SAM-dependent methyltransferase
VNEYLDNNRSLWNGWTRINARSRFYDVAGFKAGKSSLKFVELEELGDVSGKSLLHLQCHFGMDTLSWARLGARVAGVDFSDEAIELARSLSSELNIAAEFVRSNVYDLPRALDGEFDIVYTSYGVLSWLPDLDGWAQVVAHFLKPGGTFYMVEFHPFLGMIADDGVTFEHPYFHSAEPIRGVSHHSYSDPATEFVHAEFNWSHSLGEVVTALAGAGLRLEFLHEFPFTLYEPWDFLEEYEPGKGRIKNQPQDLPLMFSVRARREP